MYQWRKSQVPSMDESFVWILDNNAYTKLPVDFINQDYIPWTIEKSISGRVMEIFIYIFNSAIRLHLSSHIYFELHCITWLVSSLVSSQRGYLDWTLLFLWTTTSPVAVSLLIHLEIDIWVCNADSDLALTRDFQCKMFCKRDDSILFLPV